MRDEELLRYSRHILLPEIGIEGQARWRAAHVVVIGLGGLGTPAALYLAAAGAGKLTLCDHDNVDLTNLQRQILHTTTSVGMPKVESAKRRLAALNPDVQIETLATRVDAAQLATLLRDADAVLDCSDNFATRFAINRACVAQRVPLISGAAIGFHGQLAVFDLRDAQSPCYACLFDEHGTSAEVRCAEAGVFAPLTGIIGTLQAAEALKLLAGVTAKAGVLIRFDALHTTWHETRIARDAHCAVCGA